jgi:hypothetical protein
LSSLVRILIASVLLAGCAITGIPGKYEGTLPLGREAERHVIVRLAADGKASVSTARWGSFSYLAEGAWKSPDKRTVVIELAGTPRQRIVFQHGGDTLVAREWDRSVWGERGPGVLYRANTD